ncbi:three-helix bundle dimerization domain-containing protein [Pseudarthrobacter sp. NamE2]|uniref:three-helix bundle dimerization domain-containing protein n=1 Tax=Pseudarthrobacter sp. NamE2 TaxID=2576838 RepID=UPI001F0E80DC|nr:hypothetical protein [Pseudarthrobacter sp. NamE2]
MLNEPEARALLAVIERLAGHFPGHERSVIEQVVSEEHLLYDGVRIRDYVPILVERAAKLRLARPGAPAGWTPFAPAVQDAEKPL